MCAASRSSGRAALVCLIAATPALAQWTVTNLHPTGAGASYAYATSGGQQVGFAALPNERTFLWRNTAASGVDLSLPGTVGSSRANGVGDGYQVGRAFVNGVHRAGMWNGSNTWVELAPLNATESEAYAVSGGQQVGRARFGGGVADRAGLWTGAADTWINLGPASSTASVAYGVHNGMQVGYALISGAGQAGTWTGTAGSWHSIHPQGATGSGAYAIHEGRIAGYVAMGGIIRASVWSSNIEPWVDLNPPNSTESRAYSIHKDIEVGTVRFNNVLHASLWRGTAASWEDLSVYLDSSWGATWAQGVWSDQTTTYVVGFGMNIPNNRYEALLWTRPYTGPFCYANCDGSAAAPVLNANDFQCFLNAYAAGSNRANCDGSTVAPVLNVNDFQCFINRYAAGCP